VVFGSRSVFPASLPLSSLNGANGFKIIGEENINVSGYSLNAGDINGDGISDLFIGSPGTAESTDRGASYVVFGSRTAFSATILLSNVNGMNGFKAIGVSVGDRCATSLSPGDINGDGLTDLLIGASGAPAGANQGTSYVVFGRRSPTVSPTESPAESPTKSPTFSPIASPTLSPSNSPTLSPSSFPTSPPTRSDTSWLPYVAAVGGAIALTALGYFARRKCASPAQGRPSASCWPRLMQRSHLQEAQVFHALENKEKASGGVPKPLPARPFNGR
jgi:hypothetical protein